MAPTAKRGTNEREDEKRHFFLKMIPPTKTQQEHRIGKTRTGRLYMYEDRELKQIRQQYRDALRPFIPESPLQGPLRLVVKWLFPIRGKSHKHGDYKATRPDTDNLQKLLKDCMIKCGYWKDDALVASEICEKFYGEIPGIWIRIEELDNGH